MAILSAGSSLGGMIGSGMYLLKNSFSMKVHFRNSFSLHFACGTFLRIVRIGVEQLHFPSVVFINYIIVRPTNRVLSEAYYEYR